MVIHILPDDKYVFTFCQAARLVQEGSVEQVFLVRDSKPYKYLPNEDFLINAPIGSDVFNEVVDKADTGDRIIIHFLDPLVRNWLAKYNGKASVEWVFWSSDFYTCMYFEYPDYDPITYAFVRRKRLKPLSRFKILHWFRSVKQKRILAARLAAFIKVRNAAASKISVFHHYIKEEYELVSSMIPMNTKFNYFFYNQNMSYEDIYERSKHIDISSSPLNVNDVNLLVGNCGYPYINHLDSFSYLADKAEGVSLVLPLSYGEEAYIEEVVSKGKSLFGNRMLLFRNYMSFEEYLVLLKSCQGMLISINTPKAMGNILTLLLLGKRVFIKREMLAYGYFKRVGIKVNAIDEFSKELLMKPEEPEVVANNARLIIELHSSSRSNECVEGMIKLKPHFQ